MLLHQKTKALWGAQKCDVSSTNLLYKYLVSVVAWPSGHDYVV